MDRQKSLRPGDISEQDAIGILAASSVSMVLSNPRLPDNPLVYVNRSFERLTGYCEDAVVGRNCRFLQGDKTEVEEVDKVREAIAEARDVSVVLTNYRADGTEFRNALLLSPIFETDRHDGAPVFFLGLQRDVSHEPRGVTPSEMKIVIGELQHRVKNHLSMIVGLIRLEQRGMQDPSSFNTVSRRVQSLQFLYEEMTLDHNDIGKGTIQLGSYLGRIGAAITHLDGRPGVRMDIRTAPMEVDIDQAVRIGLVVSELLTNCMQHAFPSQESGLVELRMTATAGRGLRVVIADDGVGLPEDVEWPSSESLGGRIIAGLCDGLNATLSVTRGALGTTFTIEVPQARN